MYFKSDIFILFNQWALGLSCTLILLKTRDWQKQLPFDWESMHANTRSHAWEQQTRLPWIRESGPAKQQLWRGHRRWQHKSTQASVGPCCNKWTLLLPVQQHTECRSSTPSVFGSDEAVAGTLEPRPWLRSARDARKAFAVQECCQFCRSSHLSSLPKALCTLWTPSLLTACLEAQH